MGYLYAENEDEVKLLADIYDGATNSRRACPIHGCGTNTGAVSKGFGLGRAGAVPPAKVFKWVAKDIC